MEYLIHLNVYSGMQCLYLAIAPSVLLASVGCLLLCNRGTAKVATAETRTGSCCSETRPQDALCVWVSTMPNERMLIFIYRTEAVAAVDSISTWLPDGELYETHGECAAVELRFNS
jgi:hypothetical protein